MADKELAAALAAIADKLGGQVNNAGSGGGWGAGAPAGEMPFIGLSVPIKLETPIGSVKVFISLPPECAANPGTLMAAVQRLIQMGLPVDAYQPKSGGGGWGGGSGGGGYGGGGFQRREFNGGGGYNGGGNGYPRRDFGGRGW